MPGARAAVAAPEAGPMACALLAHGLVAVALIISYGHNQHVSDVLVASAAPVVCLGLWATRRREWRRVSYEAVLPALASIAALASTVAVAVIEPGTFVRPNAPRTSFVVMSMTAVVVVATYAIDSFDALTPHRPYPPRLGHLTALWARMRPVALLALAFGLGAWMLRASPAPAIDVWTVHQQGAAALLHGRQVYGPGAIDTPDTFSHAREIEAYAYPPLNLVLTASAYAITGETRWAQLVAILIGGVLLRAIAQRRGLPPPVPDLLMVCLLFHPRGLFVLEQAWGEPLALPVLGGFALAWLIGRPRIAAVLLGLLCGLKQHYILYLPALALLPGIGIAGAAIALATLVATYAPFLVSAPAGLWNAVVVHHLKNPFRADSLSLTARLSDAGIALPSWLGFAASLGSLGALAWIPRNLGSLLLACSLTFLIFYLLGRQAFCNYYYLLGVTWLFAAASLTDDVVSAA